MPLSSPGKPRAKRVRRLLVAVAAMLSLLLAGCAGGEPAPSVASGSSSSGSATPGSDGTASGRETAASDRTASGRETASPSPSATATGPSRPFSPADEKQAADAVAKMSLGELAGQVLIGEYGGTDAGAAAALVKSLHLGGVILMGGNIPKTDDGAVGTDQLKKTLSLIDDAARADHRTWPALIGTDQEGGDVQRLGKPVTQFPEFMADGAADDPQLTTKAARAQAAELRRLGFTIDFAPDADVTIGADDPAIGVRSAGSDPERVAKTVTAAVAGFTDAGLISTIKHFPGHGSVTVDSHQALPVQHASKSKLADHDWVPFASAISHGAPVVMAGHIAATALDPGVPASLSAAAYRTTRHRFDFTGVTMTDALNMDAITDRYSSATAAVKAIKAGADLALMPADIRAAHSGLVAAVKNGTLKKKRLVDAATMVGALMTAQARRAKAARRSSETPDAAAASRTLSMRAITQTAGNCKPPIDGSMRITGGSPTDRARLAAAARTAGVRIGSGPVVRLVTASTGPAGGDVALALDGPWRLASATASHAYAAYGHTKATFSALAAVLTGKQRPHGRLPVAVKGMHTVCRAH